MAFFGRFGEVLTVSLNLENNCTCTAIIEYFSISSAINAVRQLTGKRAKNSAQYIRLEICTPKPFASLLLQCVDKSIGVEVRKQCAIFGEFREFEQDNEGNCLVRYDATELASRVFSYLKGLYCRDRVLVDFASQKCIDRFAQNRKLCIDDLERSSPVTVCLDSSIESHLAITNQESNVANESGDLKADNITPPSRTSSPVVLNDSPVILNDSPVLNDSSEHQFTSTVNCDQGESFDLPLLDDLINRSLDSMLINELFFAKPDELDQLILDQIALPK